MTTICARHRISCKTFYAIRARTRTDGAAAVLEPRSRRPKINPTGLTGDVNQQALDVRAALGSSGLDHGPISVHDKMHSLGLDPVASIASLARIFRHAGVARLEPRKATAKAEAPRPARELFLRPTSPRPQPAPMPGADVRDDTQSKALSSIGTFFLDKVHYKVDGRRAFEQVLVITDGDKITVTDPHGEILIEHTRSAPDATCVGNGRRRGPWRKSTEVPPCPETSQLALARPPAGVDEKFE